MHTSMLRIGVISDTHNLVRPKVFELFAGVDRIIHAGDVGGLVVLHALRSIAPVAAVRGNVDIADWARDLKETELVQVGTAFIYVIHDLSKLDLVPSAAGIQIVVTGHSHHPEIHQTGPTLFLNPGSAGPRRFNLPLSCAMLEIDGDKISAKLLPLE